MSNKTYDLLKKICLVVIPAINVFLTTLNVLWNWNLPIEAITGTLSAIALLIGSILGFSSIKYNAKKNIEDFDDGK